MSPDSITRRFTCQFASRRYSMAVSFGDQCSPISDTTILSSMTTGCDLMDHVMTQIVPAAMAATLAALMWTLTVSVLRVGILRRASQ